MKPSYLSLWIGTTVTLILASVCNSCFQNEQIRISPIGFPRKVEDFGLELFKRTVHAVRGNIFMSPYSLWSVLTLAYYGAEGNTRLQFEQAMGFKNKASTFRNMGLLRVGLGLNDIKRSGKGATFNSINRAYFDTSIQLQVCLNRILFDLQRINFAEADVAKRIINGDVERATEGKISDFIQFLSPMTRFVLLNAVYFKGKWASQFAPEQTIKNMEFLIPPGRSAGVIDMMIQKQHFNHGHSPTLQATLLELPYENSNTSMYLILPDTNSTIDTTVFSLSRESFLNAKSGMKRKMVNVGLPQFKMTTRLQGELRLILQSLGITDLFDPRTADLTAFTKSKPTFADDAIHEATVEVTPEGTVAAAASGLINTRFGVPPENFVCNRPFIFLIKDNLTGVTLFAGKLENPNDLEAL